MKKNFNIEKAYIFFSLIFLALSSSAVTVYQVLRGFIVDSAVNKDLQKGIYYVVLFIIVIFIRSFSHGVYYLFFAKFRALRLKDLRAGLFHSWVKADYEDFYSIEEGKKLSYYQQQLPSLSMTYYFSFYGMGQILSELLFCSASLFFINIKLAVAGVIFILMPVFIPQLFKKIFDKKQSETLQSFNAHLGEFSDWLKGFEVIKNFGKENIIQHSFNESVNKLSKTTYSVYAVNALSQTISLFTSELSLVVVIFYGIYLIYRKQLTIGEFIIVSGLVAELKSQVYYISMYINRFIMSKVIFEGYKTLIAKPADKNKAEVKLSSTDISFDNVNYAYTDSPVLQNVNKKFTEDGIHIIYGESGSGKSTAMKILLGLLKPKSGNIILDGNNIHSIKNKNSFISFLAQEAVFFDDNLKNNLTLGRDIEEEKIFTVMKTLGLEKFANTEALNMEFTHIENKFSGGELKRLSFVRTLLQDTPIVIFDEPFANIDVQNIKRIEDFILNLRGKKVFIVTHQLNERIKEKAVSLWKIGK